MTRKSQTRHFTEEQIRRFQNDPNVRYVDDHTLRFKFEFRVLLYEAWKTDKRQGVKRRLIENGYDLKELGKTLISSLCKNFKQRGRPQNAKSNLPVCSHQSFRTNPEDNEYLLSTGKFIEKNQGITFSTDFANELFHKYPQQPIEDGLKAAGIDPQKVGYQRIYALQRRFENGTTTGEERISYTDAQIKKYKDHPYVKKITEKQFTLRKEFYDDAYCLHRMHIDDILDLFELDHSDLPIGFKTRVAYRLRHHEKQGVGLCCPSEQVLRILRNVMASLEKEAEKSLQELHDIVPSLRPNERKELCRHIDALSMDPGKKFTKKYILEQISISRTSFYNCLKRSDYGLARERKEKQDEEDVAVIRQVIDFEGYPKGTRMIYMMMKKITGKQFGINKIRRLKRKFGITCPVRKASNNRRAARELLERNVCPNRLRREFRLHRPLEVFLTDVTYIPYGEDKMAYGSAIMDAVTGRLMSFRISDTNDLKLVERSLTDLSKNRYIKGALFHSDQGSLYLTDAFQKQVRECGLKESMSKRGNCWDNAPQESFFGHFKDEVAYRSCRNIVELDIKVSNYMNYYNFDRPQWTRNRMSPVQYQIHLQNMDKEQFDEYLAKENARYEKMQERAKENAIQRAKTLGV
jgi:transposase InsO family protein